jgi:hypothetical protein
LTGAFWLRNRPLERGGGRSTNCTGALWRWHAIWRGAGWGGAGQSGREDDGAGGGGPLNVPITYTKRASLPAPCPVNTVPPLI